MTGLVRVTDPAGGHSVVCRSDEIGETVEPWFPDAPTEVRVAMEGCDWDSLQLEVERLADDDVDAETWGRLLVWPAIRQSGEKWRSDGVEVSAHGMSRVNPSPTGATITVAAGHGLSAKESREVSSWADVRALIADTRLAAALAELDRRSSARQAADAAAERARIAQRTATVAAMGAGATVYRCAQVSGLTQPGVRKMLASSPR